MNWFVRISGEFGQVFRSLANASYRTYTVGQLISLIGTHLQTVALGWTAYQITNSASLLGMIMLAAYVPVLFLSVIGGMIADRYDRRRVLIWTQIAGLLIAGGLAVFVFTGYVNFWLLFSFSLAQGIATAIEMPVRHSFIYDMVGEKDMVNAVGLNSFVFNTARMIGPALGAIILPLAGSSTCFMLNSVSFFAAVYTLQKVRVLEGVQPNAHAAGASFLDALRLAIRNPAIRNALILTGCVTCFVHQHMIMLPVVVAEVLHGGAAQLGLLTSAAAFGSVIGGLLLASRGRKEILTTVIAWICFGPGFFLVVFSLCFSMKPMLIAIALLNLCYGMQLGSTNSFLQLTVPPEYRGRVMSIYTSILVGAVPLGTLLTGHLADIVGVSWALTACAAASLLSALFYFLNRPRS